VVITSLKLEEIKKVAVIGAGVMGHGIAQVCARSGYEVVLIDVSEEVLRKALSLIREGPFGLMRLVEKGKMSKEQVEEVMLRIKTSTSYNAAGDVDYVIEAVPEDLELKKKVFKQLDEICPPRSVLASNTTSIMITEIASAVKRPDKVIGMHWFNPAPVMRLVEVVRGMLTSSETLKVTVELAKKLGKVPIEVKDGPGFFTSRFLIAFTLEAIRLLEAGVAGVKDMDEMCKLGFGFPMGPFELMDLVGLDVIHHAANYIYEATKDAKYAPPLTLSKMVTAGYLGDKRVKAGSKGGWYEYWVRREA